MVEAAAAVLAVATLGSAGAALSWRLASTTDWRAWEAGDVIAIAAGAVATLAAARFLVEVVAASGARLRGRAAPRWTGRVARGVAGGLVAAALSAGAAHAADPPPSAGWLPTSPAPSAATSQPPSPTPAPVVWAPATKAPSPVPPARRAEAPASERRSEAATEPAPPPVRVVVAGESLWSITESVLGEGAREAEIAAAWPALYDANRAVIGDDPSLIHPGQRLELPSALTGERS
ncbi:MAG: LysM peptidoglycan-binding domain-containing protein [Actinomycetes bacterium]